MNVVVAHRVRRSRSGMVFVEMLLVVTPLLLLILGLAQAMLLQVGKLGVMRAANVAVRAAVVVLDDDPRHYGGEPRNRAPEGSQRHEAIVRAAAGAVVAVAPPGAAQTAEDSVALAIASRSGGNLTRLLRPVPQQLRAITVSFPGRDGGAFGPDDAVTVEVQLRFRCVVPVSRRLLCRDVVTTPLTSRATLPNQGASYAYGSGS